MPEYRFKIGDLVRVQIGILQKERGALVDATSKSLNGVYRVTHLLPRLVTDEPRYRIKGCYGQPERVVEELPNPGSAVCSASRMIIKQPDPQH